MQKSKFLALLLAVAMVVSMVVVPVYAEADPITYGMVADKTTVEPGESFVVTVSMDTNPGFTAAGVAVHFSEGLTVTERNEDLIYDSQLRKANFMFSATLHANPQCIVLASATANTATGDLMALTFRAETAGVYEISLGINADMDQADANKQPVQTVLAEKITVTVGAPAPAGAPCPEHPAETSWTEVNAGDWTNDTSIPTGHYKLMTDIELAAVSTATDNSALIVAEGQNVCVDLNGHKITALRSGSDNGSRVFHVLGNLTVLDSTAQTVDGVYTAGTISGGFVRGNAASALRPGDVIGSNWRGGNIWVAENATFTLCSGIISGGKASSSSVNGFGRGGNIYGRPGSTINIKGGEVKDGEIVRGTLGSRYAEYNGGGNIATEGTLNITGGTISGGKVTGSGASSVENALYGGNIFVMGTSSSKASLTISNAVIKDGTLDGQATYSSTSRYANAFGGNICALYTDVTIADATVSGGTAKSTHANMSKVRPYGGNIAVENGSLTLSGNALITEGKAIGTATSSNTGISRGGNIYVSLSPITMTGNAKITNGKSGSGTNKAWAGNLYLDRSSLTMKDNAEISGGQFYDFENNKVFANDFYKRGASVTAEGTETYKANIELHDNALLDAGLGGANEGRALYMFGHCNLRIYGGVVANTRLYNATDTMTVYDGKLTLYNEITAQYYGVTTPDHACKTISADNKTIQVWHPNLAENGYCADCDYTYKNPTKGVHTPVECAEGWECSDCGTFICAPFTAECKNGCEVEKWIPWNGVATEPGHYFLVDDMNMLTTITLASSTFCLDLNGKTLTTPRDARAFVSNNATLTIMGNGTIEGNGELVGGAGAIIMSYGGSGTLNLYDITVNGGTVGVDADGSRQGGNIYISGDAFYFENCTISNGVNHDHRGGNLAFAAGAQGTLKDCTVFGGVADGTGSADRGGNIIVGGVDTKVTIDGGVVRDNGNVTENGGNIYVTDAPSGAELIVEGGAQILNGKANAGGNINAMYGKVTLNDCIISGGVATDGGNINIGSTQNANKSVFIVNDEAVIRDGEASNRGPDVYIMGGADNNSGPGAVTEFTVNTGAAVGAVYVHNAANTDGNVASGVTAKGDLADFIEESVGVKDAGGNYITYANLNEALTNAGTGSVVTVAKDNETVDTLTVSDYTLDLNGKTLTADKVVAGFTGAKIIDSKGDGLLKVSAENLALIDTNGYLPVEDKDAGGFRFEVVEMLQKVEDVDGVANAKYIKFIVADKADETYLDTLIKNGDEVTFQITITYNGGTSRSFSYDASLVKTFASDWGTKMFTCTVRNLDKVTDPQFSCEIMSKGVVIAATNVPAE